MSGVPRLNDSVVNGNMDSNVCLYLFKPLKVHIRLHSQVCEL